MTLANTYLHNGLSVIVAKKKIIIRIILYPSLFFYIFPYLLVVCILEFKLLNSDCMLDVVCSPKWIGSYKTNMRPLFKQKRRGEFVQNSKWLICLSVFLYAYECVCVCVSHPDNYCPAWRKNKIKRIKKERKNLLLCVGGTAMKSFTTATLSYWKQPQFTLGGPLNQICESSKGSNLY